MINDAAMEEMRQHMKADSECKETTQTGGQTQIDALEDGGTATDHSEGAGVEREAGNNETIQDLSEHTEAKDHGNELTCCVPCTIPEEDALFEHCCDGCNVVHGFWDEDAASEGEESVASDDSSTWDFEKFVQWFRGDTRLQQMTSEERWKYEVEKVLEAREITDQHCHQQKR